MKKILLVYKKSTYDFYVLDHNRRTDINLSNEDLGKLKEAHFANLEAIVKVEKVISDMDIPYEKVYRADIMAAKSCDIIVAVGGDGTFMEAARCATHQTIIGVNSDPNRSYGHYCRANVDNFADFLRAYFHESASFKTLPRMRIFLDNKEHSFPAMNDVLVHHASPAGLTRYVVYTPEAGTLTKLEGEEHFCSGLWVATGSGSTGAIASFGGDWMDSSSNQLQFRAIGLNKSKKDMYLHARGVTNGTPPMPLRIISKMREGKIFVDGQHVELDFPFNSKLELVSGAPIEFVAGITKYEQS